MPKGVYKHKPLSEETKRKLSDSMVIEWKSGKRVIPKNFNHKGIKHTEESKRKMSETQKRLGNRPPSRKGIKHTLGARMAIGKNHPDQSGDKNPSWKGGISFEPYSVDWTETLKRAIREKYNYICQLCNQYGNNIHHIDYDKKNCNTDNLINLCQSCHTKTNHNREYWKQYFQTI